MFYLPFPVFFPYLRLAAFALAAALILLAGWKVNGWRDDSRQLSAVKADAARQVAVAQAAVEKMRADQQAAYQASEDYQREIEKLRNRSVKPRVVRVCVDESNGMPGPGAAAGRPDAAGKAAGVVHGRAGQSASRDIGRELYELMGEADRCSAALRGLQAWVNSTR